MFYKYIIGIANGQYMHLDIASPYILYCIGDLFFTNNENSHKIFYYHVTYTYCNGHAVYTSILESRVE